MLKHIPTHLIGGPLGAGKTSLIRQLLAQRPAHERWAVLINEFGQIGLDAALLETDALGVALGEVAGGCLCCVNGVPFQVGLGRLLRKARPQRLLIEPSGLGHPVLLLEQLRQPPWAGVLAVQPPVLVLDAAALAAGQALADSQQAALASAGLLLLNKAEDLDEAARARVQAQLPACALHWTSQAALDLAQLPGYAREVSDGGDLAGLPEASAPLPRIWRTPAEPICQVQALPEGWSIGWSWHPSQRFAQRAVQQWLATLSWRRAKLVLHSDAGWCSANALDGQPLRWQASAWRKDSRLELIFAAPQDVDALRQAMAACRG
ncbi:cobalamin biosynthesis protein CobW [Pseudomonas sp. LPB0260]|uniref:CobW family GTP-binding protein n=1 Tax=Pseudomonas sp. LPB0260 TaxID=2614442 RepID=UPI0015C21D9C|nr:CobW family GTP-binding protein [Pseudomonas sp. LPB0260]QLC73125.1 cobalamin biosynthesis protein CobW [Pseudomonas sp. LPB0260]QLC75899.1 cobalamin biosynthesis protein CobW [Pseudomonas sp. LPB0260]